MASSTCKLRAVPARAISPAPRPTFRAQSCALRARARRRRPDALAETGIAVKTIPDIRWAPLRYQNGDAAPGSAGQGRSPREGAREAWFIDADGFITEGASSNAWIVTARGLSSPARSTPTFSPGVTRATLMDVRKRRGFELEERTFSRRGGIAGQRSVHHVGDEHRHARGAASMMRRSATAGRVS